MYNTHTVTNQPPVFDYNLYTSDSALQNALQHFGAPDDASALKRYGATAMQNLAAAGFDANQYPPVLNTHDRFGHRINQVDYHQAYHQLMSDAISAGLPSMPWSKPQRAAHTTRSALVYMHNQAESGTTCPTTMTFSSVPALNTQADIAELWLPGILSRNYDHRNLPWYEKQGLTIGMAMTEKQGGSDVRANTTTAKPLAEGGPGKPYLLTGHKWFCSAPMSDGFLVLAQTTKGLGCFLMPRWTPQGELNAFSIQRLKNKLGNWSNASSEIEFNNAWSWLIGEDGRGINTILEMVAMTRFDCMLGSASLMRQALAQALHHCAHRHSFNQKLSAHPAMQNVLADLAVESEAALLQTMRLAHAFDAGHNPDADLEFEQQFIRLATPVGKFWVCKRTPDMIAECLECHGGGGYVEESIMPRLFRESPLNSIWEGCGNIQCLDVLRAMVKTPGATEAFVQELHKAAKLDARLDKFLMELSDDLVSNNFQEISARALTSRLARALQASLMLRYSSPDKAEYYLATRIDCEHGLYGGKVTGVNTAAIVESAMPLS